MKRITARPSWETGDLAQIRPYLQKVIIVIDVSESAENEAWVDNLLDSLADELSEQESAGSGTVFVVTLVSSDARTPVMESAPHHVGDFRPRWTGTYNQGNLHVAFIRLGEELATTLKTGPANCHGRIKRPVIALVTNKTNDAKLLCPQFDTSCADELFIWSDRVVVLPPCFAQPKHDYCHFTTTEEMVYHASTKSDVSAIVEDMYDRRIKLDDLLPEEDEGHAATSDFDYWLLDAWSPSREDVELGLEGAEGDKGTREWSKTLGKPCHAGFGGSHSGSVPDMVDVYEEDVPFDDINDEGADHSESDCIDEEDDGELDFLIEIGNFIRARERSEDSRPAPYKIVWGPAATADFFSSNCGDEEAPSD